LIETCSRSAPAGFTTKSTAPARMAATTASIEPLAVWTITGVSRALRRISASTPRPSRPPGITRSRSTTSMPGSGVRRRLRPASPPSATTASNPRRRTIASARRRCTGSSSTISTVVVILLPSVDATAAGSRGAP
jgi:hypothetical protein